MRIFGTDSFSHFVLIVKAPFNDESMMGVIMERIEKAINAYAGNSGRFAALSGLAEFVLFERHSDAYDALDEAYDLLHAAVKAGSEVSQEMIDGVATKACAIVDKACVRSGHNVDEAALCAAIKRWIRIEASGPLVSANA